MHTLFFSVPLKGWRGVVVFFSGWGAVAKGTASILIKIVVLLAT